MHKGTIEIDDSGWGSLLGGVIIGMHHIENKKFLAKVIPMNYFQDKAFKKHKYIDKATMLFLESWPVLGDAKTIIICRGYCLNGIASILSDNFRERKILRKEIGDPLQSWLENRFAEYLKQYRIPVKSEGAHCLSFEDQLKWVMEKPKQRVKYVKTGWPQWQRKYSKII